MISQRNILLLGLAVLLGACSTAATTTACRVDADCASGVCQPNGTCAELDGGTSGSDLDGGTELLDGGISGLDGGTSGGTPDAGSGGTCGSNHDGRIERSEVPLRAGLFATFRVATDTAVNSAGTGGPASFTWDFSGPLANDSDERVTLLPIAGQWFASDFAGATYAARLSASSDLLGVFEVTSSALLLRGVVSPTQSGAFTRLTYDPPVTVLQFPLQNGANWKTTSTVSGLAQGLLVVYTETYDSAVDRRGTLKTPFGTFDVLRVRTDLSRVVGFLATESRTFMFVSECFGTVAAITSDDNPAAGELTHAAEVRRLAP